MANFAFRISSLYDAVSVAISELINMSQQVIIYQHEADEDVNRTHIHGLIMGCKRKEDTIRNKFFKGTYESSDYELKTTYKDRKGKSWPVDEKYITYMSKGVLQPVYNKNFAPELVEEYRRQWVHYDKVEEKNSTEPKKKKVENAFTSCTQIIEEFLPHRTVLGCLGEHWNYTDQEIVVAIRKWANKYQKGISMYKCRDYYDIIISQQNGWKYDIGVMTLIDKRMRM
jgi:hypothetical protein